MTPAQLSRIRECMLALLVNGQMTRVAVDELDVLLARVVEGEGL